MVTDRVTVSHGGLHAVVNKVCCGIGERGVVRMGRNATVLLSILWRAKIGINIILVVFKICVVSSMAK